jgi:hypothetical protein
MSVPTSGLMINLCQQLSKGDNMRNSAAYVGRVGGLAVALGIGGAVVTGHGIALADSGDGAGGAKSNDSSESNTEAPNTGPSAAQSESTASDQTVGLDANPAVRHRPKPAPHLTVQTNGGATSDEPVAVTSTDSDEIPTTEPVATETTNPIAVQGNSATQQPSASDNKSAKPVWRSSRNSTPTPRALSARRHQTARRR